MSPPPFTLIFFNITSKSHRAIIINFTLWVLFWVSSDKTGSLVNTYHPIEHHITQKCKLNTVEFLSPSIPESSALAGSRSTTNVLPPINSGVHTDSVILSSVIWTLLSPMNYYNGFRDPKMSKQCTAGKRKHLSLMIPQKLEIIWRLKHWLVICQ
jgi:hypothetical protein